MSIGESISFLIVAYAFGHVLQGIGNFYESVLWKKIYKGMPTQWVTKDARFKSKLFEDEEFNNKLKKKLYEKFGEVKNKDYGRDAYKVIEIAGKSQRADIFNGNYSLFRGLVVAFAGISIVTAYLFKWPIMLFPLTCLIISHIRMIRFAKYYASDVLRTFFYLK